MGFYNRGLWGSTIRLPVKGIMVFYNRVPFKGMMSFLWVLEGHIIGFLLKRLWGSIGIMGFYDRVPSKEGYHGFLL